VTAGYAAALRRAGNYCERCRVHVSERVPACHPQRRHVNHRVPRSAGGSDEADNLEVLCASCHLGRGHAATPGAGARLRGRDEFFR
jgi:5-methylcytosine-specific restriction endonuclease McrA